MADDIWPDAFRRLEADGRKRPNTKKAYRQTIEAFKKWLAGQPPSQKLASAFLTGLAPALKPSTMQVHRSALTWLLEHVLDESSKQLPSYDIPRRLPRPLSEDEIARLLAVATGPMARALVMLLYGGGLRINEALSLRVEDITWIPGYITVVRKGGNEGAIPLEPPVIAALREVCGERKRGVVLQELGDYWAAHRLLRALGREAGIRGLTPHRLRHTAATALYAGGADLYAVQSFLGHANPATTERYIGMAPERLRARLPKLFI